MGELKTLSELKSHIVYMRKHKFVIHLSKVWASKQPLAGQSLKNYGVTFKLVRCEIQSKPPIKTQLVTDDKNPFIDSDDDSDDDNNKEQVDDNNEKKHFVEKSDSESDSESEEKNVTKTKKRTVKKN